MGSKNYSVTLEEEVVEEAKVKCKDHGGKLSPLINILLKKWNETQEDKE